MVDGVDKELKNWEKMGIGMLFLGTKIPTKAKNLSTLCPSFKLLLSSYRSKQSDSLSEI